VVSRRHVRLLCNGYVERQAGSVSSASYHVLDELLRRGHEVVFVSKRSFMYPAELLGRHPNLRFVDATNRGAEWLHGRVGRWVPLGAAVTGPVVHATFMRLVLRRMAEAAGGERFDAALFLGLSPPRAVDGVATVCWVQGPPGTDVRSLGRHQRLLRQTEGLWRTALLRAYGWAKLRADAARGFGQFDRVIVGSRWAADVLCRQFGGDRGRTTALAYPIDLEEFPVRPTPGPSDRPLQVLWLGRVVPRKRLDLLLDAAALAERAGLPVELKVIGPFAFAPGLRRLIDRYPHPGRLTYRAFVPREQVPALLAAADVLCQPSDEENFGSSVAEAMACGTPVIVGHTNGTADYIDAHSVHLDSDNPVELATVFAELIDRKRAGTLVDPGATRAIAEQHYEVRRVVDQLEVVLRSAKSKD
jgi:glycosyltransferase involved in cell wall biosynthesis